MVKKVKIRCNFRGSLLINQSRMCFFSNCFVRALTCYLLTLPGLLLTCFTAQADGVDMAGFYQPVLRLSDREQYSTTRYYQYHTDTVGLSVADALKAYRGHLFHYWAPEKVFNIYGRQQSTWFALTVENPGRDTKTVLWSIANMMDSSRLYVLRADSLEYSEAISSAMPASERKFDSRQHVYRLRVQPGERLVYMLRIYKTGREGYLPMWLDDPVNFMQRESYRHTRYGWYFGFFSFVVLLNGFFFIALREPIYGWYALYISSFCVFIVIDENFNVQLFDSYALNAYLNAVNVYPFWLLSLAASIRIMQLFCLQKPSNSWLYYPAKVLYWINLAMVMMLLLGYFLLQQQARDVFYSVMETVNDGLLPVTILVLIVSLLEKMLQRMFIAAYYLVAILCLTYGSLNYFFNHLGLTNVVPLRPNGLVVGTAVEVVLISLLLSYRYLLLHKEQQQLLMTINEQQESHTQQLIATQEQERSRIAKDLHDDVGGTLSSINIYGDLARKEADNAPYLEAIQHNTLQVIDSLGDIVWNIDPRNDNVGQLAQRMHSLGELLLKRKLVKCYFSSHLEDRELPMLIEDRRNIYLLFKEAINNVVKHSDCTECHIALQQTAHTFSLDIRDNGRGFDAEVIRSGANGLRNIKARAYALKGDVRFSRGVGGGTLLQLRCRLR